MKVEKNFQRFVLLTAKKMPVLVLLCCLTAAISGCDNMQVTSGEQLKTFEDAGLGNTDAEKKGLAEKPVKFNAYKIAVGDIVELQMPMVLKDVLVTQNLNDPYTSRVNETGDVCLPIIGEFSIINKTLTEAENEITNAYYPKYFKTPPAVVCRVKDHMGERSFTVTGLVKKTGVFSYPTNVKYSLVDALSFSEGVDVVADPHYVKIYRRNDEGKVVAATFKIDGKSFSQASNVIIKPGDVISVQTTPRTQTNRFLADVLRFNFGVYVNPQSL